MINKLKVSRNLISNSYNRIIKIGFCQAENLLKFKNEFAYSCGKNNWFCDYYFIDDVIISTGQAPIENKNAKSDYDTIKKYEDIARNIVCDNKLGWKEQKTQVNNLLSEFIQDCIKNK